MSADVSEFHRSQYDMVRREIESCVAESRANERYAVAATGAVWTWLATHRPDVPSQFRIVWAVPALLAALGFIRNIGLQADVRRAAAYLEQLEAHLTNAPGHSDPPGWETYLATSSRLPRRTDKSLPLKRHVPTFASGNTFWITLLAASIGAAWFFIR